MKKMSEVFELPLIVDSDNDIHIGNGDWILINPSAPECVGAHVAHAINHVDALAENLSKMVNMFERLCEANDFDADRQFEYVDAKAALAAYRGEL